MILISKLACLYNPRMEFKIATINLCLGLNSQKNLIKEFPLGPTKLNAKNYSFKQLKISRGLDMWHIQAILIDLNWTMTAKQRPFLKSKLFYNEMNLLKKSIFWGISSQLFIYFYNSFQSNLFTTSFAHWYVIWLRIWWSEFKSRQGEIRVGILV